MNAKRSSSGMGALLCGALLACSRVPAAHAEDTAPEPDAFVRACHIHGAGFLYIPGTRTCVRTGGYLRFQYNYAGSPAINTEGDDYQLATAVRARINFDAREETAYGTLRAFIQLQAQNSGADTSDDFVMESAYMQLGGFLAGYNDTLWSSHTGGIEDGLQTDNALQVGDIHTNQINYTFTHGGLSLTAGLEDGGTGAFTADPQVKLAYTGGWGGAYLGIVYDESFDGETPAYALFLPDVETRIGSGSSDAVAIKAGLRLDDLLTKQSSLKLDGHWASSPTTYATIAGFTTAPGVLPDNPTRENPRPGAIPLILEWSVGAGVAQRIDRLTLAAAGRYGRTFDYGFPVADAAGGFVSQDGQYWALVGDVGYDLTANMNVLAEVTYTNVTFDGVADSRQTSGLLRFERTF